MGNTGSETGIKTSQNPLKSTVFCQAKSAEFICRITSGMLDPCGKHKPPEEPKSHNYISKCTTVQVGAGIAANRRVSALKSGE